MLSSNLTCLQSCQRPTREPEHSIWVAAPCRSRAPRYNASRTTVCASFLKAEYVDRKPRILQTECVTLGFTTYAVGPVCKMRHTQMKIRAWSLHGFSPDWHRCSPRVPRTFESISPAFGGNWVFNCCCLHLACPPLFEQCT